MKNVINIVFIPIVMNVFLFCSTAYGCTYRALDFWDPVPEYKSRQQELLEDIDSANIIVHVKVLADLEEEHRHVVEVIAGWKEEVPSTIFLRHPSSCGPGVWDTSEYILFLRHVELSLYFAYEVWPLNKAAFIVNPILGKPIWSYSGD